MEKKFSFPKDKIKILLLERIHPVAVQALRDDGYSVEEHTSAFSDEELAERIEDVHVLGIRSKTQVTEAHLERARRLLAIGCFSVGTNQVALQAAARRGVPVFNSPYGNTRSVAELAIAEVIMLLRHAVEKNSKMHRGEWDKSATGINEVRGKALGIIGYGHIGQQVGILAESLGMRVRFYDILRKLPLGNAVPADSMADILRDSDVVTIHIPALPGGGILIGREELALMKPGAYLLNLARGSLVDLPALKAALQSGALAGAGVDVYPSEPKKSQDSFECELTGLPNVILTPHVGGSTEEAQERIGSEVADSFIKFVNSGTTTGAVNFPQIDLPTFPESSRILHVHKNAPGVLNAVNSIVAELGANIDAQYLSTTAEIGYLIMDLNREVSDDVMAKIAALPASIKTRLLY